MRKYLAFIVILSSLPLLCRVGLKILLYYGGECKLQSRPTSASRRQQLYPLPQPAFPARPQQKFTGQHDPDATGTILWRLSRWQHHLFQCSKM